MRRLFGADSLRSNNPSRGGPAGEAGRASGCPVASSMAM
jgi:hypothetical protein